MATNPSAPQKLVEEALVYLKVDQVAGEAGLLNKPPSDSDSLDANELKFVGYFSAKLREVKVLCEARLEKLAVDRTATEQKIDIEQTKHSFSKILNSVEPGIERLRQRHSATLRSTKEAQERALRQLRFFQQRHGLYHRSPQYPESLVHHFALIAAVALVEWVALSSFYAEGSDFGLLGGIFIAMSLSLVNIILAILVGNLLRYVNHESRTRQFLSLAAALILTLSFSMITLAAAHYRVATNEIAAQSSMQPQNTQPQVHVPQVVDQWKTAKLAGQRFAQDPIGFSDFFSWVLVLLALLFGIVASYKGYTMDDPYPGYGANAKEFKLKTHEYDTAKDDYMRAVDHFFDGALSDQSRVLSDVKTSIDFYQALAGKTAQELKTFLCQKDDVQEATRIIVARYRQKNTEVRNQAAPKYFGSTLSLDDHLTQPPAGLSAREERMRSQYASAVVEFSEIARTNDEALQKLRTYEFRRLQEFFERLEKDIREKLEHEDKEFKGK